MRGPSAPATQVPQSEHPVARVRVARAPQPHLVGEPQQVAEEPRQVHLPRGQLATARVVGAVQRRGRVDDEQRVARLGHHRGRLDEQRRLVVRVVRPRVGHVVQDLVALEAVPAVTEGASSIQSADKSGANERVQNNAARCGARRLPLSDGDEALGAEGALGVDVEALALAAALLNRELCGTTETQQRVLQRNESTAHHGGLAPGASVYLAGHGQGVAELGLASAELAENLGQRARLDAAYAWHHALGHIALAAALVGGTPTWACARCWPAPPSSLSSSLDPVVIMMISDRRWWNSVAVVNPMGTSLDAARTAPRTATCVARLGEHLRRLAPGEGPWWYWGGRTFGENLVALGLAEALDGEQRLLGRVRHGLDGVEAGLDELLDVGRADARALRAAWRHRGCRSGSRRLAPWTKLHHITLA